MIAFAVFFHLKIQPVGTDEAYRHRTKAPQKENLSHILVNFERYLGVDAKLSSSACNLNHAADELRRLQTNQEFLVIQTSHALLLTRRMAATAMLALTIHLPAVAETTDPYFDFDDYNWHGHTLYINANITSENAILAYDIHADGSLHALSGSPFPTGGKGFFDSSFKLGPFDVDQEMAINGNTLYAVNAGSNSISAFAINRDGSLSPIPRQPFISGGSTPVSVGVHGKYLVTVDSAQDPEQAGNGYLPGLTVSTILDDGGLRYLTEVALPADAQPSQALTTNTGPYVFSAEFPGGGMLDAFYQYPNGRLVQTDSVLLPLEANNSQPLPLGLWTNPRAPYLYVGFVNTNEVGVYTVTEGGKLLFVNKVPNSGTAVCWLRVSSDGRFLYTSNTADESMSVYDLSNPALPVEIQHIVVGGMGGVQQFSLSPDGAYVYLLQQENSAASVGHSNNVYVLKRHHETGLLTLLDSLTTHLSLPPNTRPFGVSVR